MMSDHTLGLFKSDPVNRDILEGLLETFTL
jgi:hypothetical protein